MARLVLILALLLSGAAWQRRRLTSAALLLSTQAAMLRSKLSLTTRRKLARAAAQTARIAAWNLGGFFAIPAEKLDRIIDGLALLEADIVVLPELNPLSHG